MVLFLVSWQAAFGAAPPFVVSGHDLFSGKPVSFSTTEQQGLVLVFLSAVCPCSNSHVQELNSLSKAHPEFLFVGIHTNLEEKTLTQKYFQAVNLPFPILRDQSGKLATELKALKTPHAFVIQAKDKIVYQGGVSSSHDSSKADHHFLRDALEDLKKKQPVRTPFGRTLGCAISRGENYDW